jgi:hypothetical protein
VPIDLGRSATEGLAVGFDMGRSAREGLDRTRALMHDRRQKEEAQQQWAELQEKLAQLGASEQVAELNYQTLLAETQQKPDVKAEDLTKLMLAQQPIWHARTQRAALASDLMMQWVGANPGNPYVEKMAGSFMEQQANQLNQQTEQFSRAAQALDGTMRSDVMEAGIESGEREGAADRASREKIAGMQVGAQDRATAAAHGGGGLDLGKILPDILQGWQQESMTAGLQDPKARREYARSHFGIDQDLTVGDLKKLFVQEELDTYQGLAEGRRFEPPAPAAAAGAPAPAQGGPRGRAAGRAARELGGGAANLPGVAKDYAVGFGEGLLGIEAEPVRKGEPAKPSEPVRVAEIDKELAKRNLPKRMRVRSNTRLARLLRQGGVPTKQFVAMSVGERTDLLVKLLSEPPQ